MAAAKRAEAEAPAIGDVIAEIVSVKRRAGRAESYIARLDQIGSAFCSGRENLPIEKFTLADVERFIDSHSIRYRSTLRSKLSTMFKFAIRRGYRVDNPCARLETVSVPHEIPAIFTVNELELCLRAYP